MPLPFVLDRQALLESKDIHVIRFNAGHFCYAIVQQEGDDGTAVIEMNGDDPGGLIFLGPSEQLPNVLQWLIPLGRGRRLYE